MSNLTPQQIADLTVDEIVRAINLGVADGDLQKIAHTVKRRQQATVRTFKPGDRVKLVRVSPQYLVGLEGTVQDYRRTRINIVLDHKPGRNYGKFESSVRLGIAVGVTPDMVERIEA